MNDLEEYKQYLASRRSSSKTNYYLESLKELKRIHAEYADHKPSLLLHVCCGVCAGWPLEFLAGHFDLTIYYNNSNIWPEEEYSRRLEELRRLVSQAWDNRFPVIVPPYDNLSYTNILSERKDDPEGWKRCFLCYETRMEQACCYAEDNHFDYFTTVMTISRQKDSQKLNEIGMDIAARHPSVRYFPSDFKKKNGQVRRDELVHLYDLYSQDYCGCIFSWEERQKKKRSSQEETLQEPPR